GKARVKSIYSGLRFMGVISGAGPSPDLLTVDAVFLHPGAKGAGVETKDQSCSVFTINAPTGFQEHLQDIVMFHLGEDFDVIPFTHLYLHGRIEPVQHLKNGSLADNYSPL